MYYVYVYSSPGSSNPRGSIMLFPLPLFILPILPRYDIPVKNIKGNEIYRLLRRLSVIDQDYLRY